jgi:hypothetical protein
MKILNGKAICPDCKSEGSLIAPPDGAVVCSWCALQPTPEQIREIRADFLQRMEA